MTHIANSDWGCKTVEEYFWQFATHLAQGVALSHAKNIINDTLSYDNVTLAAEMVDFEWIYLPEVQLLDGYEQNIEKRKLKNIIYLVELLYYFSCLMSFKYNASTIADFIVQNIHDFTKEEQDILRNLV